MTDAPDTAATWFAALRDRWLLLRCGGTLHYVGAERAAMGAGHAARGTRVGALDQGEGSILVCTRQRVACEACPLFKAHTNVINMTMTAAAYDDRGDQGRPRERVRTAPDTETRVIVDLMLALNKLLNRCDLAEEAGSTNLSIASVRRIAAAAVVYANESAYPADPVSDSELSRRIAGEMARRSAARSTS